MVGNACAGIGRVINVACSAGLSGNCALEVVGNAFFGGSEIHFARDGFQDSVGAAALLHGKIEEGRLVFAFGLHDSSDPFTPTLVQLLLQRLFPGTPLLTPLRKLSGI